VQFLRHRHVRTQTEYIEAKARATKICRANRRMLSAVCAQEGMKRGRKLRECLTLFQQVQRDRKFCSPNKTPTDLLIAANLRLSGVTPRQGPSLILSVQPTRAHLLETVVHEGLHRLEGRVWGLRSRARAGTGWRHSRTRRFLAPIKEKLDEGVVQILTKHITKKMKRWFGNYVSNRHSGPVSYVMNILKRKNKNINFLVKAFFSGRKTRELEDLQYWQ